jgi:hypothetical protein
VRLDPKYPELAKLKSLDQQAMKIALRRLESAGIFGDPRTASEVSPPIRKLLESSEGSNARNAAVYQLYVYMQRQGQLAPRSEVEIWLGAKGVPYA